MLQKILQILIDWLHIFLHTLNTISHNNHATVRIILQYLTDLIADSCAFAQARHERQDRYNVFLSGKFDRVRITSNAEGGKLLLLGDSYLMPMIQLFADQYKELMIVDIRLFEDKDYTIEEAIGDFEPDRIVFVDTVFAVACGTVGHF